jgi:hypothetical protein
MTAESDDWFRLMSKSITAGRSATIAGTGTERPGVADGDTMSDYREMSFDGIGQSVGPERPKHNLIAFQPVVLTQANESEVHYESLALFL